MPTVFRRTILGVLLAAIPAGSALSLERKPIVFSLPEGEKRAWVEAAVSFSPGVLPSLSSLRLVAHEGKQVPSFVKVEKSWFDGSVMLARIGFKGRKREERKVWLEWGTEVRNAVRIERTAKGKRVVDFRIYGEAGDLKVKGDIDVGTMVVRVERHAGFYYYWYLIPISLILGWLIWRKFRLRRRKPA